MSNPTPNLNLPSPVGSEYMSRAYFVGLVDSIDENAASKAALESLRNQLTESSGFGTAQQPTTNKYTLTLNPAPTKYSLNMRITVKIPSSNTGPATINVNGLGDKTIKRSSGADLAFNTLKAGGVYALVYDGTNFTLLGEGGEYGNATAAHVLSPFTIGTDSGLVTGTIPTRGNEFKTGTWSNVNADTFVDTEMTLDGGYYPPGTKATAQIEVPSLVSKNLKSGANVLGVPGDPNVVDTSDANLVPDDITQSQLLCYPYTAYSRGIKVWGVAQDFRGDLIPVTAENPNAGTRFTVSPPQGGFVDSNTKYEIFSPNLQGKNIRRGITMLGVPGAMGAVKNITRSQVIFGPGSITQTVNMSLNLDTMVLYFSTSSIDHNARSTKVRGKINANGLYFDLSVPAVSQVVVRYQIVEYDNVKQIIRGDAVRETGTAAHIVTLPSAVDMNRTFLIGSYNTDAPNDWEFGEVTPGVIPYLATNNQILLMGSTVVKPSTITKEWWSYQVVEFL